MTMQFLQFDNDSINLSLNLGKTFYNDCNWIFKILTLNKLVLNLLWTSILRLNKFWSWEIGPKRKTTTPEPVTVSIILHIEFGVKASKSWMTTMSKVFPKTFCVSLYGQDFIFSLLSINFWNFVISFGLLFFSFLIPDSIEKSSVSLLWHHNDFNFLFWLSLFNLNANSATYSINFFIITFSLNWNGSPTIKNMLLSFSKRPFCKRISILFSILIFIFDIFENTIII